MAAWRRGRPSSAVQASFACPLDRLAEPGLSEALNQALEGLKRRLKAASFQVYLALPDRVGLWGRIPPPPKGGKKGKSAAPPLPLDMISPFPRDEIYHSLRPDPARAGARQVVVARREVVDQVLALLATAGLQPKVVDLRRDYLSLAWPRLLGKAADGLFVDLEPDEAAWCFLAKGKFLTHGVVSVEKDESPGALAKRAAASAWQNPPPGVPRQVFLAGRQAAAAMEGLDEREVLLPSGDEKEEAEGATPPESRRLTVTRLRRQDLLPPGLAWPHLALYGFLAGKSAAPRPLFNLSPIHAAPTFWERPGLTVALGAVALVLLVLLAGQGLWAKWAAYHAAQVQVADLREALAQLREERKRFESQREGLVPLLEAQRAKHLAPLILSTLSRVLPPGAYLKSLDLEGQRLELAVAGANAAQLEGAFAHASHLRLAGKPTPLGGSGTDWKVVLTAGGDQGAAAAPPPAFPAPGGSNPPPGVGGAPPRPGNPPPGVSNNLPRPGSQPTRVINAPPGYTPPSARQGAPPPRPARRAARGGPEGSEPPGNTGLPRP
ncbi:MAG: hypothetical protein KQJ78_21885 [Deltaproteobacteria bacterium]|nr:hypothetical protein [Deltaproteobacteria bacterium]